MQQWERECHIARIIAGKNKLHIGQRVYYLTVPNPEQRFEAAEIYREARRDAELDGALSEQELLLILNKNQIWTSQEDNELQKLNKALESLKVELFENRLRSNAKLTLRSALRKTKEGIFRLESLRHILDYITVDGLALSAKYRYLISASLRYEGWETFSGERDDPLIDNVIEIISHERLGEPEFRKLARTEPWRSIWSSRQFAGRGIFDVAAVNLSDDQRTLIIWSSVYDNIREYPDCPNDDVISDDDMLDGWMIIQRKKKESQIASNAVNSLGQTANTQMRDKLQNAEEVFLMADTIEDAREIEKMNDAANAMNKSRRLAYVKQHGEVNEVHMPDTTARIRMEMNRLETLKMRQTKGQ